MLDQVSNNKYIMSIHTFKIKLAEKHFSFLIILHQKQNMALRFSSHMNHHEIDSMICSNLINTNKTADSNTYRRMRRPLDELKRLEKNPQVIITYHKLFVKLQMTNKKWPVLQKAGINSRKYIYLASLC